MPGVEKAKANSFMSNIQGLEHLLFYSLFFEATRSDFHGAGKNALNRAGP